MFTSATFWVVFFPPCFLTRLLLPQVDHPGQRQGGAEDQRGHDTQYDAHDRGGDVGLVVHHGADVVNLPVHKHLQSADEAVFTSDD